MTDNNALEPPEEQREPPLTTANLDAFEAIRKEVRRLTVAVWVVAITIILIAAGIGYTFVLDSNVALESLSRSPVSEPKDPSPCKVDAFFNQADTLMQGAKYKEVVALADERLKTCPADHYAWWFKAKALAIQERWDDALEALRRTELLRPDWRKPYVVPLRESIEWNKERKTK